MSDRPTHQPRRAAVVCRHPATQRQIAQALGTHGLTMRQALSPALLPRSTAREFDLVIVDLDIDPGAAPTTLVEAATAQCPGTPILAVAGAYTRHRLCEALAHPAIVGLYPKVGTWIEAASGATPGATEGPDEQDLAVTIRRLTHADATPPGPAPYLLGGTAIEERVVGSTSERDQLLAELDTLAERLGLADEKVRRLQVVVEELVLNAIYAAPRDSAGNAKYAAADRGTPLTLGAQEQVRVRFGVDGRTFALSVADRFGALTRAAVAQSLGKMFEQNAARDAGPRGLGLIASFTSANHLVFHGTPGRFTEVTAILHIAGSNRAALTRGSSLALLL
jgi:hypothetical protein